MNWAAKAILTIVLYAVISFSFCSAAKATIVFSISSPVISSDDGIEVDASISGLISSSCSTSGCFLQAELQSAGGYFGYTFNNSGEYVDFFKNPASTDEIKSKLFNITPVSGAWSGKLKAKNNPASQNYYGPGEYLLTFRRFSGNSLSPTSGDSNSLSVTLGASLPISTPSETPQMSPTPTPTPTPFTLKTAQPTHSPTPVPTKTPSLSLAKTKTLEPALINTDGNASNSGGTSSILGVQNEVAVSDSTTATEPGKLGNKIPLPAVGLVILGVGLIGFSVLSIIRSSKRGYTIESENENNQIS